METLHKSKLMRKKKLRHNEKARDTSSIVIDKKEQNKIKMEDSGSTITYDECNTLVLPSKKRSTRKIRAAKPKPLLSKKKQKLLQKVVDKKIKKEKRAGLLEELSKVQANPAELACLESLQTNQTLGRKQFLKQERNQHFTSEKPEGNIFKGLNKRRHTGDVIHLNKRRKVSNGNYNIVDTSSSDEDDVDQGPQTDVHGISETIDVEMGLNSDKEIISGTMDDVKVGPQTDMETKCEDVEVGPQTNSEIICDVDDGVEEVTMHTEAPKVPSCDAEEATVNIEVPSHEAKESEVPKIPAVYKILKRSPEIIEYRSKLPVVSMEYEIMTAINENPIVIIDGSTGSGKTTQVPQFLYEAGFTNDEKIIAVTEPRRVATIEMSKRVAFEMNLSHDEVSYQIRFEGNTTDKTKIKFLTDGVLLKEFLADPLLEKYSAVIVDEAHERSVFSDIMIGILSRISRARQKTKRLFKVVIMSATMDKSSFTDNPKLFDQPPPVVKVDSKLFDVAIHYNKITYSDYVDQAYKKACKVHRQLPIGGILIFATGKAEVLKLCQRLSKTFPKPKKINSNKLCAYEEKKQAIRNPCTNQPPDPLPEKVSVEISEIKLSDFSEANLEKTAIPVATSGELEDDDDDDISDHDKMRLLSSGNDGEREYEQPLHVLPMYSMLNPEKLNMVFEDPPPGTRLCVVATNIAETSLTIPNIVYVIDTGKIKGKVYNPITGISKMNVMWTSKASADQRKGRAGRVQNGHCYRLYSATVLTDLFASHAPADILRRPVDDVVLAMKTRKIPVLKFPYITPPPEEELLRSIKRLTMLGALSDQHSITAKDLSKITPFGRKMSLLSVAPRYSKMLLESFVYPELLPYFILLVCCLTVQEVLLEMPNNKVDGKRENGRLSWLGGGMSRYLGDLMLLMMGILKAEESPNTIKFCKENGLRYKAYQEIRKLRRQITNEANLVFPELSVPILPEMKELSNAQANVMRKIILQGSVDRIAKKIHNYEIQEESLRKKLSNAYRIVSSKEPIYLHFSSPFRHELPTWVVFQDIYEVNGRNVMTGVSTVEPQWVVQYAPEMCQFSDPIGLPKRM